MDISIPYGKQSLTAHLPDEQVAWVLEASDREPVPDVAAALRQALAAPIGSPSLAQLAREARGEVTILVDDATRCTPQPVLLPIILDELNRAGVSDGRIVLVAALGTHRPLLPEEQLEHLGRQVLARVPLYQPDALDPATFIDLGESPSGVPIQVVRRVYEAGLSLAVGNIVPHMFTGFSGGAKMVQPGICSPLTTGRTHLMAAPHVQETLGRPENPVRAELDLIARRARLGFIVNTVLNRHGQVVEVVAGDLVAAHRKGVATAREVYGVPVAELADIVVAGACPADRDLWQGLKPINTAAIAARPGGEVIIAIAAPEGISHEHPYLTDAGTCPVEDVYEQIRCHTCPDQVAAAIYVAWDVIRRKVRVTFVSEGIDVAMARQIGAGHAASLDEAVQKALARAGKRARIGVIPEAGEMLPLVG